MSFDISIIIINYKSWKHLEICLDSINKIDSTDFSFEVLVVDNASTDDTDKILDGFGAKITRLRNDTTVSLFENHNVCINCILQNLPI